MAHGRAGPNCDTERRDRQTRGKTILGPITHGLESAGFTIVLGPNGAGKTTLLNVLHGVERLSNGSVTWASRDHAAHQEQAFVFQRPIMLRRTVRQNLAYPLQLLGRNKRHRSSKRRRLG